MERAWLLEPYSSEKKQLWNDFVNGSRNAIFLFYREYMDYHADRFQDHSLLCYQDGKLMALLPAHLSGSTFASHNGLTFGGFLVQDSMTAQSMLELFQAVVDYLKQRGDVETWCYRPIPYIYARYPSQEDLYALFRLGAVLKQRKISSVIPSENALGFSTLRKRKVKKASQEQFCLLQDEGWAEFWAVLRENLQERHQATPVHTLDEILLLHQRFPQNILLYRVCDTAGQTVAGTVLYVSQCAVHVQYIASTDFGRQYGAVDFLFDRLIHEHFRSKKYFDMGTSVEQGGWFLNEGLIFQKEGMGGRAVVYDMYELPIRTTTR